MIPMLEMAGKHSHFIPDILYVWNNENPINEHKIEETKQMQKHVIKTVTEQKKYLPLEDGPLQTN